MDELLVWKFKNEWDMDLLKDEFKAYQAKVNLQKQLEKNNKQEEVDDNYYYTNFVLHKRYKKKYFYSKICGIGYHGRIYYIKTTDNKCHYVNIGSDAVTVISQELEMPKQMSNLMERIMNEAKFK